MNGQIPPRTQFPALKLRIRNITAGGAMWFSPESLGIIWEAQVTLRIHPQRMLGNWDLWPTQGGVLLCSRLFWLPVPLQPGLGDRSRFRQTHNTWLCGFGLLNGFCFSGEGENRGQFVKQVRKILYMRWRRHEGGVFKKNVLSLKHTKKIKMKDQSFLWSHDAQQIWWLFTKFVNYA